MFDGVSNSDIANELATLDGIPVYTIAAPPQAWNAFGQTTNNLIADRPDQFVGVELVNGSHTDSVIGSDPFFDFFAAIFVRPSAPGNATAVHTLAAGWINDFYVGAGPDASAVRALRDGRAADHHGTDRRDRAADPARRCGSSHRRLIGRRQEAGQR